MQDRFLKGKITGQPVGLDKSVFQTIISGERVGLFILENRAGMKVAITNYGGRIVSWLAPDKNGAFDDIVLGFNNIDDYLTANETYYGALIGRYANRIADGKFSLDGQEYTLAQNDGSHHLHGGLKGFESVVWKAKQIDAKHLQLRYSSADGEEGYPGNLQVQVDYMLTDQNEVNIDYTAVTNRQTPINLTNHAFFNLAGSANGKITDHQLLMNADYYTPVDSTLIPTGDIAPVENTPFDFRTFKSIGSRISDNNKQLNWAGGYDHNFVLKKKEQADLSLAAKVTEPQMGRMLEVFTTEPGIQFYSGNFLDGSDVGKKNKPYTSRSAFCLEPQHFPNAPNESGFPNTNLAPGEMYSSLSIYRLSVNK